MLKGLFTSDFIAALAIFIAALLIISPLWGSMNNQVTNLERSRNMQVSAMSASDILIRTTGSPENWDVNTVKSLGLANGQRILNATKCGYFFQFLASNYSEGKFMVGAGEFEMVAQITDKMGMPIIYNGINFSYSNVSVAANEVVNSQRFAILKYNESVSEMVNLKIILWR